MGTKNNQKSRRLVWAAILSVATIVASTLGFSGTTHADDLPVTHVSGSISTQTWTAGNVYVVDGYVEVDSGVTLTVDAGAIVKIANNSTTGIYAFGGGTVNVNGTSTNPVMITSAYDDSAGGDSNGDGVSSGAPGDYARSFNILGGTLNISHATVRYADLDINLDCTYASTASLDVEDSVLNSKTTLNGCAAGHVTMIRDEFNVLSSTDEAINIHNTVPNGITLTGSNKNTFSGNARNIAIYIDGVDLPSSSSWTLSSSGGAVIVIPTYIEVDGTLNVEAGTIIKEESGMYSGLSLFGDGALAVNGTSTSPVIFTSLNDDAYGGDTFGDGSSTGSAGNYNTAIALNSGTSATISNAKFLYATTAVTVSDASAVLNGTTISHSNNGLSASGDSTVSYRGSFDNISSKAIQSCNWGSNCMVDAAYVDWGSSAGPFATNPSNNLACGSVTVSPWTGQTSSSHIFDIRNCDNSDTYDAQLSSSIASFESSLSSNQIQCGNGFEDFCSVAQTELSCLEAGAHLAAFESPFSLPDDSAIDAGNTVVGDVLDGGSAYINGIEESSQTAFNASVASGVHSLTSIFTGLISSYNSCH